MTVVVADGGTLKRLTLNYFSPQFMPRNVRFWFFKRFLNFGPGVPGKL